MAIKVTEDIIRQINERYAVLKVKAKVARELGLSAGTVSKYIIDGYIPESQRNFTRFNKDIPDFDEKIFAIDDWSVLCKYTEEERAELAELQKEILV